MPDELVKIVNENDELIGIGKKSLCHEKGLRIGLKAYFNNQNAH